MAGGELSAVFKGLAEDASQAAHNIAESVAKIGERTAENEEANLGRTLDTEAQNTKAFTDLTGDEATAAKSAPKPPGEPGGAPTDTPGEGGGPSPHRPDDPSTTASGVDDRNLDADPVDVVTGEVVMSDVDVALPGLLPLVLRRTHVSSYRSGRSFGPTWSSTLDQRLVFDDEGALFLAEEGVILVYPPPAPDRAVLPVAGAAWPLTVDADGGGYRVTNPDSGWSWEFDRTDALLRAIRDRNGNVIQVLRDDRGVPVELHHSGGYRVAVGSTDDGLVTDLRLVRANTDNGANGHAADISIVRFGYAADRLVEVINSSGRPMRFTYDPAGRVTRWEDRNGFAYQYAYRADGRCVRGTGQDGMLSATFDYDLTGRVTTSTDSTGGAKRFAYDAAGHVARVTDQLGNAVESTWDVRNRLRSRTDAAGNTVRYDVDDAGNLVTVEYPDGATITAEHNALGQPVRIADSTGAQWHRRYDERGNLIEVTDPVGATTTFHYGTHGELTSTVDALGQVTTCRTNPAGLVVAVTDPSGATVRYMRDEFGRVAELIDPVGGRTQFGWTVEGRLTWRRFPDGTTDRRRYDAEGNLVEHIDAAGGRSTFGYTAFNQMIWHQQPDGARTSYAYDTELRMVEVTNPVGAVWRYDYDAAGRLVAERDFSGRELRYEYDVRGRYTRVVNGLGQATELEHDRLGRLVRRASGDHVTAMEYDVVGRLVRATTPDAELRFGYDLAGQVVSESVNGRTLTNAYDLLGRRIARTTPTGVASAWTFDAAGNPRSLNVAGRTIGFEHDAAGRETSRRFGTVDVEQFWEPTHRLRVQAISTASTSNATGRVLVQRRSYQYRPDGYLTGVLTGGADRNEARDLAMDPVGRITSIGDERYTYDPNGNITADSAGPFEYAAGRLRAAGRTSYQHDGNGRVVQRRVRTLSGQVRTWRYAWDAEDRLREVITPAGVRWRYGYDAFGRRIAKSRLTDDGMVAERVDFTWDGTVLAEQEHVTADRSRHTTWEWLPRSNRPLAQAERTVRRDAPQEVIDQAFNAIVTDLIGTPTELVTESGEIAERLTGSLWGTTTGPTRVPLRFPGQYHDDESGLHYNVFRYYDPAVGRFYSEDPIGLRGGTNPSGYVPNPTAWADPLGLTPCRAATGQGAQQTTTQSGWAQPRPPGITGVDPQQIINLENQMGFPLKNGGAFDQGTLGKYFASHAERQAAFLNPNLPVRVDKEMCQDCQNYFQALAQHTGQTFTVHDPVFTRIFEPDGSVHMTPNPGGVTI